MRASDSPMTMTDPDVLLPPAPPKRRLWRTRAVVIATVVGALIGIGAGAAIQPEPSTVTKTEAVAPQSCLDALDLADEGFTYAGEAMGAASDGFDAASRFDIAGLKAASGRITAAGDKIQGITGAYQAAKADCRSAG
jgi:hypothetical protein